MPLLPSGLRRGRLMTAGAALGVVGWCRHRTRPTPTHRFDRPQPWWRGLALSHGTVTVLTVQAAARGAALDSYVRTVLRDVAAHGATATERDGRLATVLPLVRGLASDWPQLPPPAA